MPGKDFWKTWHEQNYTRQRPAWASQRQLRVGELVRHAIAEMLSARRRARSGDRSHLITVPEVRMTADLRLATVYVMPLGGTRREEVLAALERNKNICAARSPIASI